MSPFLIALQFIAACLVLGLGLFLATGAVREIYRSQAVPVLAGPTIAAFAGVVLLAFGAYAARMTLPI
jgi:hypothetical protein